MPQFRTRLFEMDAQLPRHAGAWGLGWSVRQRHFTMRYSMGSGQGPEPEPEKYHHLRAILRTDRLEDGSLISALAPELIINARDFDEAQRVMRLIRAGYALSAMELLDESALAVPDSPSEFPPQIAWQLEYQLKGGIAAQGYFRAARVAAKASKKMIHYHALSKFYHGFRTAGSHWMETHPNYPSNTSISRDPMQYIGFAHGIIAFYSVLEELKAHVIASQNNPSTLSNGQWNPPVLEDLRKRLTKIGIDPDSKIIWLLRGTRNRIEGMYEPPAGEPASWARGGVRDREVPICDAIRYASILRSRVSAHRVSARTRSLTLAHLCNVQMLAREVLTVVLDDPLSKG